MISTSILQGLLPGLIDVLLVVKQAQSKDELRLERTGERVPVVQAIHK